MKTLKCARNGTCEYAATAVPRIVPQPFRARSVTLREYLRASVPHAPHPYGCGARNGAKARRGSAAHLIDERN